MPAGSPTVIAIRGRIIGASSQQVWFVVIDRSMTKSHDQMTR
jgi:hypothetical protein